MLLTSRCACANGSAALIESMFGVTISDDYRPVAWMGRYPVDVTTMLVGVHVAAAILTAILVAFGAGSILAWLQFDSAAVLYTGQVWRLFTYAFVHAPSGLIWPWSGRVSAQPFSSLNCAALGRSSFGGVT